MPRSPISVHERDERRFEAQMRQRFAAEQRLMTKLDRLEPETEKLIGTHCREGKTVHYINLHPYTHGASR